MSGALSDFLKSSGARAPLEPPLTEAQHNVGEFNNNQRYACVKWKYGPMVYICTPISMLVKKDEVLVTTALCLNLHLVFSCRPWYFQLRPKVPWTFLLFGSLYTWVQNQSRKTSVIRLPRFTTENIAKKWPQNANFSIKNLVSDNYCFGSLMRGVFLDWFLALFYIWTPQKQKSPWNFWSSLETPGVHCVFSCRNFPTKIRNI